MARKDTGQWSLMLSIHGSGDRLAAQAPPDWQLNAEFYDGERIRSRLGTRTSLRGAINMVRNGWSWSRARFRSPSTSWLSIRSPAAGRD